MKRRIVIGLFVIICSFLIIRFGFFDLYGSYDAPLMALLPAIIGIVGTVIIGGTITPYTVALGYPVSFLLSQLFKVSYIDPKRGNAMYNNYFEIWIISYSIIILLSLVADTFIKRINTKISN